MELKSNMYHLKKLNKKPKWTSEQKTIIAWALATDGHISITKNKSKKNIMLQPRVAFYNTDFSLVDIFIGIIQLGTTTIRKLGRKKDLKVWESFTQAEVEYILLNIVNFLPSKVKQAKLVLEFLESRKKQGIETKSSRDVPYTTRELEIYEEIRKLNKRGK